MFLKKLLAMITKEEVLVYTSDTYKMYDTVLENKKATKFALTQSVAPYTFLKKIKHDTIIFPYKLNAEKRSMVTRRVIPFEHVFRMETKEFNKYILLKVARALDFLHSKCEVAHRNVVKESLFFSEDGGIVLGGFEKSIKSQTFGEDSMMFSVLASEILSTDMSLRECLENDGFCSAIFFDLEVALFGYKSFTEEQKLNFISDIRKNIHELIDINKRRIAWLVLADLNANFSQELKMSVVDFILDLKISNIEEFLFFLFSVLDTNIRLHLLRNSERYVGDVTSLDPIVENMVLGIKCKDKQLAEETVLFVGRNIGLISRKRQTTILQNMYEHLSDEAGMKLVLEFLSAARPTSSKGDIVYKILCKCLIQLRSKETALAAIEIFFKTFNKFKLATELLPLLCGYLSDKHIQTAVFSLMEKIFKHLKEHKEEITSGERGLWAVKEFFNFKHPDLKKDVTDVATTESAGLGCRESRNCPRELSESDDEWDKPWNS